MKKVCSVLLVILAIAARANASPIVISNITGSWQNPVPAANATVSNVAGQGADLVRWGGTGDPLTDSGYSFDPTDGSIAAIMSTPFALGQFTHFNQPIPVGSSIDSISYDFAFATNGTPNSLSNVFHFTHNETVNETPCPTASVIPCDDIVDIGASTLNSLIIVGADQYFFNLLGFSTDGGVTTTSQFLSPEFGANSATLYGVITSQPLQLQSVPEPASLVMLGTGMAFLTFRLRKRVLR